MKNIMLLSLTFLTLSSCSNMKADAEKACDFTTQIMEMMPQMMQLSMKAGFGDEDSKKEAQKELDKLQLEMEQTGEVVESIKSKYNEDEFQAAFLENCEVAKKMLEMGEDLQDIGE